MAGLAATLEECLEFWSRSRKPGHFPLTRRPDSQQKTQHNVKNVSFLIHPGQDLYVNKKDPVFTESFRLAFLPSYFSLKIISSL